MRRASCLISLLILTAGCGRSLVGYYPEWNKSRIERLELLEGVERVAVAPVETGGGVQNEEKHYVPLFERALGNRLMGLRRFRLVPDEEFKSALDGDAEPPDPVTPDAPPEPFMWDEKELLEAARTVNADAVLAVRMEDVDPYLLPRVVLRARLYLARRPNLKENSIIDMTDDGIPLEVPKAVRGHFIWQQDFVLDAHDESVLEMVGSFARTQGVHYHGFGAEVYVRSMRRFLDFAGAVVAQRLFKDAQFYHTIEKYKLNVRLHSPRRRPTQPPDEQHLPIVPR